MQITGYNTFLLGNQNYGNTSLIGTLAAAKYKQPTIDTIIIQYFPPLLQEPECVSTAVDLYVYTPLANGGLKLSAGLPIESSWTIVENLDLKTKYLQLNFVEFNYLIEMPLSNDNIVQNYFTPNLKYNQTTSFYPIFYYMVGLNWKDIVNNGGSFLVEFRDASKEYKCLHIDN